MRIYQWNSRLLEAYSTGDIIVMAADLDAAKALVRDGFDEWCKENRYYEWAEANGDWGQEIDRDGYEELLAKLEADLAAEPKVIEGPAVLWMRGSE